MAMISTVPLLILLAEVIWQIFIKYPPTLEQINLGVSSAAALWVVRFISLGLLLAASFFVSRLISIKKGVYYWILVLASPVFSLVWMSYPLDALKIFIVMGIFYFLNRYRKTWIVVTGVLIVILTLNLSVFKQNPKILEALSIKKSQEEVTLRFNIEDKLNPSIEIPIQVRRIGYNKYFAAFRNSLNESLNFFDFETVFFEEIHPLGQKAFVIFFWPEVFLFGLGLWFLLAKQGKNGEVILTLLFFSFIYFITSSASTERRLFLTLYPLSIIMAGYLDSFLVGGSKKIKIGMTLLIFLIFYGWMTNYYDRYVRPDYWLDNRPIAYNFFLSYLKDNPGKYDQILVPDTLYAAKEYCRFYLDDCDAFKIKNFDLSKDTVEKNSLYVGFIGNFTGPNPANSFPPDISNILENKGIKILKKTHILNNIANGYGQELLIVGAK